MNHGRDRYPRTAKMLTLDMMFITEREREERYLRAKSDDMRPGTYFKRLSMFSIYSSESSNDSSGTDLSWLPIRVPNALRMRHSPAFMPFVSPHSRSNGKMLQEYLRISQIGTHAHRSHRHHDAPHEVGRLFGERCHVVLCICFATLLYSCRFHTLRYYLFGNDRGILRSGCFRPSRVSR